MPGFGASGGWFGVPVCANSVNQVAPGGADLSCDRTPRDFPATGCAPGVATSDGYGLTFQCVELVARFSAWAFGVLPSAWRGDAPYLWLNGHHPSSFSAFTDGGTHAPVPGDILVWGSLDHLGNPWPAGPAGGHVAVVAAVGGGRITFVEENMLGQRGNIPEEITTLTQSDGHWTVGPTYGTNGGRALYGWLHAAGNTGHFGGAGVAPAQSTGDTSAPSALPSLAQGVIVTGAGALAQTVWSDTRTAARLSGRTSFTSGGSPHALVESLGAPPGGSLAPGQVPAVVTLPSGERYSFVRGQNGRLYAVYLAASNADALWQSLGAPTGATLTSPATALWDGETMIVGALGSDGALWTRSGPPGMLDNWVSLGQPASASVHGFQGTPSLVLAPGAPATSATGAVDSTGAVKWLALAIGRNGALYEADGRPVGAGPSPSSTASPAEASGWNGWTPVAIPGVTAQLTGALLVIAEPQTSSATQPSGSAPTTGAVDALVTDTGGRLRLLRRASMGQPWQARSLPLPDASATLVAAMLASPASRSGGASSLHIYTVDSRISAGKSSAQFGESGILASTLSPITAGAGVTPKWTLLGFVPPLALGAEGAPVALELTPKMNALLLAQGAQLMLLGDQSALSLLATGSHATPTPAAVATDDATSIAPALAAGAGTVTLGTVAPPSSFSDAFTGSALDPRWAVVGASPTATGVAQGALTLAASTPLDRAEVAQGVPTGDFTVTARVTPDTRWGAGAQAGILLALDDWNMLTLSLRADGKVALCPVARGKTLVCQTEAIPALVSPSQGIYLRVTQSAGELSGEVSADGAVWSPVGVWSLSWLTSAEAQPMGAYAPPVASIGATGSSALLGGYAAIPLRFTSLDLFVEGANAPSTASRQEPASVTAASAKFSALTVAIGVSAAP